MDPESPVYAIGTASALTGFSQRQLRYYESIGILRPTRTEGGQRLYSPSQVDRLLVLRSLLDGGMTLAGARAVLAGRADVPPRLQEESAVPLFDHTALAESLQQGQSLNSLFPVKDQQSLHELLIRIREKSAES